MNQITGIFSVGATANFFADIAHGVNFDHFAILIAEKSHGTGIAGGFDSHFFTNDGKFAIDGGIDQIFGSFELFRSDLIGMGEVKAQPFSGDMSSLMPSHCSGFA